MKIKEILKCRLNHNKTHILIKSLFILSALFLVSCSGGFESVPIVLDQQLIKNDNSAPITPPVTPPAPEEPPATETPPPALVNSKPTLGSGGQKGNVTGNCIVNGVRRNYALHVPQSYNSSNPTALVVAMHGLGDDFQNFNQVAAYYGWHSAADQKNFIFMTPASTNQNRESFLYFSSGTTLDTTATQSEASSLLECLYRGVGSKYNIETHQIYWIGFSEGASFVNYIANDFSEQLKAVAIYGGSAPRLTAQVKRLIPIYFLSGTLDSSYSVIVQQSQGWSRHPNQRKFVNASHSFSQLNTLVSPTEVWTWMSTVTSEPVKSSY